MTKLPASFAQTRFSLPAVVSAVAPIPELRNRRLGLPQRVRMLASACAGTGAGLLCLALGMPSLALAQQALELPLTGPAYQLADQAYRAYAEGNYAAAAQRAQEALRLRPDVARLRKLLSDSREAAQAQSRSAGIAAEKAQAPAVPPSPAAENASTHEASERPTRAARKRVVRRAKRRSVPLADTPSTAETGADGAAASAIKATVPAAPTLVRPDEARAVAPVVVPAPRLAIDPAMQAAPTAPVQAAEPGPAERAYAAIRAHHPREAAADFAEADSAGVLQPHQLQDAAYASVDAGDPAAAAGYFRRALDASDAGTVQLEPQQRQDIRVAVADAERTWGAGAAAFYRSGGTLPGLAAQDGSRDPGRKDRSLQAVAEAYWRPMALKGFGGGGNTYVDFYGRVLGTPYSGAGYAQGSSSTQGALGIRVKPLSGLNLVGAAERLVKLGSDSRNDWLLRLGYSAGFGQEPRIDRAPWWSGNLYAEAGRYLDLHQKYFVSEAQLGRSWRVDPEDGSWSGVSSAVLTPHIVLAADYNDGFAHPRAIGAGVGVTLRLWLREDARSGPRSYADLTLQARRRLSGDDRAGGVVFRLSYNY
jgi:hypothetical protein